MYVILIVLAVLVLQGVVFLFILVFSNNIIVLDESHVCISRVLAPVIRELKDHGSLLGIEDVVKALDHGDDVPLRYTFEETNRHWERESKPQVFRVGLFNKPPGRLTKKIFPEGKYD